MPLLLLVRHLLVEAMHLLLVASKNKSFFCFSSCHVCIFRCLSVQGGDPKLGSCARQLLEDGKFLNTNEVKQKHQETRAREKQENVVRPSLRSSNLDVLNLFLIRL